LSVYKRGGVYWYEFQFHGQRYRESTRLNNKTAAERAESIHKAALAEGRAGLVQRKACPNFKDFVLKEFLPWDKKGHDAHPNTHKRYQASSKPLIELFGNMRLNSISQGDVEQFKVQRFDEISAAGTNRDLAALRYMLNFAVRLGYTVRNPVSGVRFLEEGPGSMRIISHEEERIYLAAADSLQHDLAILILDTGMRPGEVFTIRAENMHLDERYLFNPFGKTRFARRNVPLTDRVIEVLRNRMGKAKGAYLFPHRKDPNKPMTEANRGHEQVFRRTDLDYFRIYDLRHTFGSRSIMAGVDLPTLKELMGHSTITITMRYVHPTPEHKRAACEKLERFNTARLIAAYEDLHRSPQKSPQIPM
jgi:integrase